MSTLFSPLSLGKLALDNRIIIAPMCQYSANNGSSTAWHDMHLGNLAQSGAGLLIIEASAVEPEGRITYGDLGLWDDTTEASLDKTIKAVRSHSDMPIAIQLAHAGRKAEIVQAFADSAKRALRIGFEAIELHGAHGYLLHQFLSPHSNKRDDEYGGSLENRMRFALEVYDAVRREVGTDFPVGMRISASDWVEGGWDIDQSVELAKALKARGCDFIHVSSGGLHINQKIPLGPNYQVPFADRIESETGITTIAVGLITEAEQAEAITFTGQADAIALARGILYDPRWPWHAAATLGAEVKAANQYLRCQPRALKKLFG